MQLLSPIKSPSKSPKKTISSILKDHGVSPTKSPSKSRKSLASIPLIIEAPPISPSTKSKCDVVKDEHTEMAEVLGTGPMRFGPPQVPISTKESMRHPSHLEAYIRLKVALEQNGLENNFTDSEVLRVARYHNFDVDRIVKLLKRMDPLYWNTSIFQMAPQLQTQTLFPLPNKLKTKDKKIQSFFYMNWSRHVPSQTHTSAILANVLYVMDSMDRVESNGSRQKMGLIANVTDFTMDNFSNDFCKQFVDALQGKKGPVHVDLVLLVNPSAAFEKKAWPVMKTLLSSSFKNKVHMIQSDQFNDFLVPGFDMLLPNEFANVGQLNVEELVEDFTRYREYLEAKLYPDERHPTKETGSLLRPKRQSSSSTSWLSSSTTGQRLKSSSGSMHNISCSLHTVDLALGRCEHDSTPPKMLTRNNPNESSLGVM